MISEMGTSTYLRKKNRGFYKFYVNILTISKLVLLLLIHSTVNPFEILSKNGPEEDVLAQNTSDTWEKLQIKTVNSDWRNPDTRPQLNLLFKDLINRKIEILPTYSEGYFEVDNLHKLLDIINEIPRSTLEVYINFPEGYELYIPLLQRLRDIIREDVEEHELPLTVIEFIHDVKQGHVFQGMEKEMNQLRRNCDINEIKYEYEPKKKEDTLSQGSEDEADPTTTSGYKKADTSTRGYKEEVDSTTLGYEEAATTWGYKDVATTKWGYEDNTTRGFEDEATTTTRGFEDEATTTTRGFEDEATTTTIRYEEAITTKQGYEDEATTTTREFEDEATTTTRGFEDEATTTTRGFEDEATTTTREFEDEATTTRKFEDEASTTWGSGDEATTTTQGFKEEATTTTRGFENEAATTTLGFENEAATTTRGFENEATTTTRGFENEAATTTRGFENEATTTTIRYEEAITTKQGYEDEATTREYKSDNDSVEDILVQNTTEIWENLRMKRETFDLNDPINLILPNEQQQVHPSTTIGGDMLENLPYKDVLEQNKSDIWDEMRKKFPQIDFDNPILEEDITKLVDENKNRSLSVTGVYDDEIAITTEGYEDEIAITTEGYEDEIAKTTEGYEDEVTITTGGYVCETTTRIFEDLDTITTERYKDEDPITLEYEGESTIRGDEDKTTITEGYDDSFTKSTHDEATTTQIMYEDKVTTKGYEDQDVITTEGYEDGTTITGRKENETTTTTGEFVTKATTVGYEDETTTTAGIYEEVTNSTQGYGSKNIEEHKVHTTTTTTTTTTKPKYCVPPEYILEVRPKPNVIGIPDFDKPSGMFDGFFGEIYNKLRIFTKFVIQKRVFRLERTRFYMTLKGVKC
ncbi:S-antigen protein [Armadillidium nasatum]|uniref:S-antigen protein n=1 Tax=Armadillidium nasatum TaxID=96803 RepID=A0A5N5TAK0_9CRUS|nr:S-antigen protein [Armadillidium nasatum]